MGIGRQVRSLPVRWEGTRADGRSHFLGASLASLAINATPWALPSCGNRPGVLERRAGGNVQGLGVTGQEPLCWLWQWSRSEGRGIYHPCALGAALAGSHSLSQVSMVPRGLAFGLAELLLNSESAAYLWS